MGSDIFVQKHLVGEAGLNIQNPLDVAQVLLVFSFLVEDHFPEDDVFHRSDVDWSMGRVFGQAVLPSPSEGLVTIAGIEVGLKPRRDVDEVEMAAAVTGDFRSNHIGGRAVIFGFRKTVEDRWNVFRGDKQRYIDIQREARFAVVHGADRTCNQVADSGLVQRACKKGKEIRFWRGRIHGQQFFGIPLRKDRDGLALQRKGGHFGP